MANWKTTCDIKQHLNEDLGEGEICARIARDMKANACIMNTERGPLLVEWFSSAASQYESGDEDGYDLINSLLDDLYDFGDRERILFGK